MEELKNEVTRLADRELKETLPKYGLNHSNHESVAVFREEVEEAYDELRNLDRISDDIWEMTKKNEYDYVIRDAYEEAYKIAISLACEAIQAAAMARKGIISNYEFTKKPTAAAGQEAGADAAQPVLNYGA